MVAREIRELLVREPFHPFRVRAGSGAAYDVSDPSLAVVLKSQLLVIVPKSDRYSVIPFLHVAGIEMLTNGHAPRPGKRRQ